jgi:hypothetical protein
MMIFGLLRRKRSEPSQGELAARAFDLSLPQLLEMLSRQVGKSVPTELAMVLIAFANARSDLKAHQSLNTSRSSADLPTSYADYGRMIGRLFDKYAPTQEGELDVPSPAEIKFRRLFHFYRAAILGAASERAHETNERMQDLAIIWNEYIDSASQLPSVLAHTRIWTSEELEWFSPHFDERLHIENVLYTIVPKFLWEHGEMLDMAKQKYGVWPSSLKRYY